MATRLAGVLPSDPRVAAQLVQYYVRVNTSTLRNVFLFILCSYICVPARANTRTHVVHILPRYSLLVFPNTLSCLQSLMNARTHARTHIHHTHTRSHAHITVCLAYMVRVLSLSWYFCVSIFIDIIIDIAIVIDIVIDIVLILLLLL